MVKKQQTNQITAKIPKHPLTKADFEAVLKAATKPLNQEQGEKESK